MDLHSIFSMLYYVKIYYTQNGALQISLQRVYKQPCFLYYIKKKKTSSPILPKLGGLGCGFVFVFQSAFCSKTVTGHSTSSCILYFVALALKSMTWAQQIKVLIFTRFTYIHNKS